MVKIENWSFVHKTINSKLVSKLEVKRINPNTQFKTGQVRLAEISNSKNEVNPNRTHLYYMLIMSTQPTLSLIKLES